MYPSSDTNFNLSADVRARGVAPERPASPSRWWREVCPIAGTRLVISGDLPGWGTQFGEHLQRWVTAGVTHIIDVRDEWNDANAVRELAPAIVYHWLGTDDDGYGQPDAWFDAGVDAALDCMADPTAVAMIHCHMGVNRGPSMSFAVLLAMGWHPLAAIEAIRAARPIAAVLYAMDALDWWHRRSAVSAVVASEQCAALSEWIERNPVDVGWVISRIRRAEGM